MDTLLNIKYKISNNDPGQQLQNISVLTCIFLSAASGQEDARLNCN